jgi:signal peptidase I
MPTTSSEPTIMQGDYTVADMCAYKNTNPDYGDIVIFSTNSGAWTFRIAGKPNDTISIVNNSVVFTNKTAKITFVENVFLDNIPIPFEKCEETLPNGRKYLIYRFPNSPMQTANIKSIIIPDDSYFVLGDNRDNAMDSRYIGFIKRDQIKGKITYILFGKSFSRHNIDLTK